MPTTILNLVDFETGNLSQAANQTGDVSVVGAPSIDGKFCCRVNHAGAAAFVELRQSGTAYYNAPTAFYRFYLLYQGTPGNWTSDVAVCNFQDGTSGYKCGLHLQ